MDTDSVSESAFVEGASTGCQTQSNNVMEAGSPITRTERSGSQSEAPLLTTPSRSEPRQRWAS